MKNRKRMPIIGSAFDADQRNEDGRIQAYVNELEYYRPRGFRALAKEGVTLANLLEAGDVDAPSSVDDWKNDVETMLTDWARRTARHDFISFGSFPHTGDVGFLIDVDSAMADADLLIFLQRGDVPPKGFSGLACTINDHGNVTAETYSRGRKCRTLFEVV